MLGNSETSQALDEVFQYAKALNFGEIHIKNDNSTGLFGIIAIHSTKLGPAIGGCRCIHYPSTPDAIRDALRLASLMTYKAAICGLPHGGAKSVIMAPPHIENREALFESFGSFVDQMNGRYIAAVDSGTEPSDMDFIGHKTKYVICTSKDPGNGDPSPYTALGVRRGIEAAVKHKLNQNNLKNIHVVVQGAGHVGYRLIKDLINLGAKITVGDTNKNNVKRCVEEFGVATVSPDAIYDIECDVFAPCALGGVINPQTIPRLKTSIVAGCANNQLENRDDDQLLLNRNILYAPDFLINAGGLIFAAAIYDHGDQRKAQQQIYNIYDMAIALFDRAKKEHKPTNYIAEKIAEERLLA